MKYLPFTVCFLLLLAACQKSTDQRQQPDEPQIFSLGPTCDFCAAASTTPSCCCIAEVVSPTTSASIQFCGTTSPGTTPCSFTPPSGCSGLSAGPGQESATVTTVLPYEFCAAEGYVLSVTNTGGAAVWVKITCFTTTTVPDPSVTFNLASSGTGYVAVRNGCVVRECM